MTRRGRCKGRRKSMAGGRGTAEFEKADSPNLKTDFAEKPLDSPEITELPSSSTLAVDLYSQARKVLSFRSPYDSEDSPSTQAVVSVANNLPTGVSNLLGGHSDSRKRHKKLQTGTEKKSSASLKVRVNNIWQETEEYFRELTVEDIERLERLSDASLSCDENFFFTPCLDEDKKSFDRQETVDGIPANSSMKDIKLEDCIGNAGMTNHNESRVFQNGDRFPDGNAVETSEMEMKPEKNGDDPPNGEGPLDSFFGVERLLGCRSKVYLSSERPSKKRKLSSTDTVLEKLHTASPVGCLQSLCHCCSYGDLCDPLNSIIKCSSCGMVAHQRCYGVLEDADIYWLCSWCKLKNATGMNTEAPCILCPKQGGALKPVKLVSVRSESHTSKLEFAHLFCCLWMPDAFVENTKSMEHIMIMNESKDMRKRLICSLCKMKNGICIRCCSGSCRNSFHPICAREANHQLEIWGKHGSDEVEIRAFCLKHSKVRCNESCPETGDSSLTSDCVFNGYGENPKETEANLESRQDNGDVKLLSVSDNSSICKADKNHGNPCITLNFSMILRTLIDLHKVNAETVASDIGVAPHSLTAVLSDKDNDPLMQSKVARWLINNAHFGSFQKTLKQKMSSLLAIKDDSGVLERPCSGLGADSTDSLGGPVKSVVPHRRSKSSTNGVADQADIEKILNDPGYNDIAEKDYIVTEDAHSVKLEALTQSLSEEGVSGVSKQMRLMEVKSNMLRGIEYCQSSVLRDGEASQASTSLGLCCNNSTPLATSADRTSGSNGLNLDQLTFLRNCGIRGLAPADDVEGELMYYQQRLIYMTVSRKHLTDDLISKVVRSLPEEIATAVERKWDAVLVNQYNHNQREAKKQGRKERRHKEAQEILAAATAAAAASSRISSNRKDILEESSQPEDLLKIKQNNIRQTVTRSSENSDPDRFASSTNPTYTRTCDVCSRSETMLNPVLLCSGCKVSVHLDCYRSDKNTVGPWHCELCEDFISSRSSGPLASNLLVKPNFVPECALCGGTGGALRKSVDGRWIHALCAEWILDSTYRRGQVNPIEGIDSVCKGGEVCTVCNRQKGAYLKCSYGHCSTTFHPTCARSAGFYMTVRGSGSKMQHKAYCAKHTGEQRSKAEIQKHGIEELKSLKQIRVELERLRLLCERIVRREKLKRELVLCSHDVLASSRDSALSALARHPFYQPEVSSESATTCVKGHMDEYRGMVQRADDITVDCTVAGKRRVRLPVCFNNDQKTEDSGPASESRHRLRLLPNTSSRDLPDVEEKQLKSFRNQQHTESLGKELISSDVKNQRLLT